MNHSAVSSMISMALTASYAATVATQTAPDRTVLPIHKLQVPHSTVFDVPNATPHLSSRKRGFVIDKTGNFGRK